LKDTSYIIIFGLFSYLGFATIFGDSALMGSYGAYFAFYNHKYFGYISYIYIFAFMIPLYIFYKDSRFDLRKAELLIASFLLFFASLLFQSMVIDG
jgi:S-DNA-T family DNA segregation ATPase FtsK/SpoIIIE